MKKLISLFVVLTVVLAMIPITSVSASHESTTLFEERFSASNFANTTTYNGKSGAWETKTLRQNNDDTVWGGRIYPNANGQTGTAKFTFTEGYADASILKVTATIHMDLEADGSCRLDVFDSANDANRITLCYFAGGHLAALTATYFEKINDFEINDEISEESFIPDGQILCYPVINLWGKCGDVHFGSGTSLLGDKYAELSHSLTPANITSEKTPPAFIWHTFEDDVVNVKNSLDYAKSLKDSGVPVEMHIYPNGRHGLDIPADNSRINKHILQWTESLIKWLVYMY